MGEKKVMDNNITSEVNTGLPTTQELMRKKSETTTGEEVGMQTT
jgi:hypothetical protein